MLSRHLTLGVALTAGLAATPASAQTERLYSLIVNETTLSPAEGTPARTSTGQTATGGLNAGLFAADVVAISEGTATADQATVNAGATFTSYNSISRFDNADTRGVVVYDFDLNQVSGYENLTLDIALASDDGADSVEVFLSYNDAEAGLSLDADLAAGFTFSGFAILDVLDGSSMGSPADTDEYTPVAGPASPGAAGTQLLDSFSLDAIRDASDDGLLRIAISANGFRRNLTVVSNNDNFPGLISEITGTPVPEPASLALLGLGGLALAGRRRR